MWNECIKILENGKKLPVFKESHSKPFYHYMMSLGGQSVQNVWYDTVCDVCFGEDRTFHNSPGDFVFFSAQGEFINDPMWGDFRLQNTLGIPLGNERLVTDEFIHSYHPHFSRYKDKNILIVGAGPSTLDVDWEGLDLDFDYVWTCNSFFLNDRVLKQPIDLVAISPEVNIQHPVFLSKIREDNTLCVFEGGVTPYRPHKEIENLFNFTGGQVAYTHMRFFSKLGVGVRLLPLAFFLGAKKVYFVGVDGHPVEHRHAFEGENKKHTGAPLVTDSYNIYRRQFVLLWEYLLKLNAERQTQYYNLGEVFNYNQSRDITQEKFPLPEKVIEHITKGLPKA